MRRNRIMDMMMRRDGRNPYGARGGYSGGRRDRRAMEEDFNYGRDYRSYGNDQYSSGRGDSAYSQQDNARGRRDYESGGQSDMARGDYGDIRGGRDGHYPMGQGSTYFPIEAMGRFSGYWGEPRGDYNYDMARGGRGRRDYGMDYDYARQGGRRDYGMDYRYDYESGMLEQDDIEEWSEKLKKQVEEKDKQFFSKEHIKKKAEEMGIKFDKFSFEEFMVTTLMMYTDYCKTLGTANMDIYLRLAKDWLCDEDVAVKYGEKLATYYDYIVEADN